MTTLHINHNLTKNIGFLIGGIAHFQKAFQVPSAQIMIDVKQNQAKKNVIIC